MKILHTSDLHIGKIVNEFSMIEDQRHILKQIEKIIEEENIDVLMIAGDIYDRSIPPVEAVELLNNFLSNLTLNKEIKVLAIAGNHDGGERLCFGNQILEKQGLHIVGRDEEIYQKISLEHQNDKYNFYLIPYKDPSVIKKLKDDATIKNHNDAMKATINMIEESFDKDEINILISHGYMTMKREKALDFEENIYEKAELEISESERPLSIGGTDLIDAQMFQIFDYVALGHLHGRQQVGVEKIRYSGSPLKYSFSEVNHKKGVYILDLNKEKLNIEFKELKALRDMRVVRGNIEEILEKGRNDKSKEDYIQAILIGEGEIINPIEKLRTVYPNIMMITRERKNSNLNQKFESQRELRKKDKLELFEEFYNNFGQGEYSEEKKSILSEILSKTLKKEVE